MRTTADRSERNMLTAIRTTSNQLHDDILSLTQFMNKKPVGEPTHKDLLSDFQNAHADTISRLSLIIDTILVEQKATSAAYDARRREKAQSRICKSLSFELMSSRTDQIREAEDGTYTWLLVDQNTGGTGQGGFQEWLDSPAPDQSIFWIFGKPGAGKSTLLRYLEWNLNDSSHGPRKSICRHWLAGQDLFVCKFFLWNPGYRLQKSLCGLLRSILHQCFSAHLWSIEIVVSEEKWSMARSLDPGESGIEWSLTQLKQAVENCLDRLCMARKVFLLLDGLDELDGTDEERGDLLTFLHRLSRIKNLKLCASSRPWNIFSDFFCEFPKFQIQDFTRSDIGMFVRNKLSSDIRQQSRYLRSGGGVKDLIEAIIDKASGVFLWVRLVVQELLRGFRDGETIRTLREKVDSMPPDLDGFFRRMINSIDPPYRQEGSAFLQTALFSLRNPREDCPRGLLEFTFLEYKDPEFVAKPGYHFNDLDFNDLDAFEYRIDLGKRRLNSRCMGLLEPVEGSENFSAYGSNGERTHQLLSTDVSFLHRSLMEFLYKPDSQILLEQLTNGPFQAHTFLCSASLAKVVAVVESLSKEEEKFSSSWYFWRRILSSTMHEFLKFLALSEACSPMVMEVTMAKLKPAFEIHLDQFNERKDYSRTKFGLLSRFRDSKILPVRIAVSYGIVYYVKKHLAENQVEEDDLRDLLIQSLDYTLVTDLGLHPALISLLLEAGADPNAKGARTFSIWNEYLCQLQAPFNQPAPNEVDVIEMMVKHGAEIHHIKTPMGRSRETFTLRHFLKDMKLEEADRDRLGSIIRMAEEKAEAVRLEHVPKADLEETQSLTNPQGKLESGTTERKRQKCQDLGVCDAELDNSTQLQITNIQLSSKTINSCPLHQFYLENFYPFSLLPKPAPHSTVSNCTTDVLSDEHSLD